MCLAVNSPKQAAPDYAGRKFSTGDKQRKVRNGYFGKNRSSRKGTQIYPSMCQKGCKWQGSDPGDTLCPREIRNRKSGFIPSAQESFPASSAPGGEVPGRCSPLSTSPTLSQERRWREPSQAAISLCLSR